MGEGLSNDALLMPLISSANIACGYHAGDEETMKRTVTLALENNVAIGAHPGFKDKINFGRTEMHISLPRLFDLISEQLFLLQKIALASGTFIHHVKPHGAMYNMAARDASMSHTIASAVKDSLPESVLYGLSGSHLISEATAIQLNTASEVFADRTYLVDGGLTPRNLPGALIENTEECLEQVLQMVEQNTVKTINNQIIAIKAETICIHGDGEYATAFAAAIRNKLIENNITIQTIFP